MTRGTGSVQVVIPMGKPVEAPEQFARERVAPVIAARKERLTVLRQQEPDAPHYVLPLPWYAHENSRELELIAEPFRPAWNISVRRGHGCLELVLTAKERVPSSPTA
jgi:hypothetical protein